MKFKRIDENSIRCIISREEMDEHGIGIDDLMDDRNKAETFLRYILQQARDELNFEMTGGMLNVQLSVAQNGDVALMISDNEQSALRNLLNQFRDSLQIFKDALEEKRAALLSAQQTAAGVPKALPKKTEEGTHDANEPFDGTIWAEFSSLSDVIRLSNAAPELGAEETTLYKYHDTYYLCIALESTRHAVAALTFTISEYALTLYSENSSVMDVIEHGQLILENDAMLQLAAL